MNAIIHPLARFLVALIFLLSGIGKVFTFEATAEVMRKAGFPAPSFFLVGAVALLIFGGVGLVIGFKTKYAAIALIVFLIPATIIFHATRITDPVNGQEQIANTLKNLALLGALLKFAVDGAGLIALDNYFARKHSAERNQLPLEAPKTVSA